MISHKPAYGHQTTLHTPPKKKHEGHSQEKKTRAIFDNFFY